jgi:hypothetical protein
MPRSGPAMNARAARAPRTAVPALPFGALTALAVLVVACAPARTPPAAPAPEPVHPTAAERAAAAHADSVRAARAAQAEAEAAAERAARAEPVGRFASLPRPASRLDTLAARPLSAPVRVCAGGDVTLGTNLDTAWANRASKHMRDVLRRNDSPSSLVAPLRPLFAGADLALVNVESAIGEGPAPSKCGPNSTNCFAFRAPLASARAIRSLAPRAKVVGNLANNHARDAGRVGQDSTVAALRRAGAFVSGDDTLPTLVPTATGDTVAVLGFYTSTETPDARDTAEVRRLVERAADQYPVVIVTMHLGAEGRSAQHTTDSTEIFLGMDRGNPVAFAEAAVRGGATLVIGHGPHVLRAVEWPANGALVAYSLGNLLTYGPFVLRDPLNRGAVLCATIDTTGRVRSATLAPTIQRAAGVVARDRSRRGIALVNALGRADFPQSAARVNSRGALAPAKPR